MTDPVVLKRRPLGDYVAPGWNYVRLPKDGMTASIVCPRGHFAFLADHTIAGDGTVSSPDPDKTSVQCPHEGCDFHANVKLEGWNPSEA